MFGTKFQTQEIPVEAAERCSGKLFLGKLQASSFWPEMLLIGTPSQIFFKDFG